MDKKEKETMPVDVTATQEVSPVDGAVATEVAATTPSGRDLLVERLQSYNPGVSYEDDESLYNGMLEMLDSKDNEVSRSREKMAELADVFGRSPQAAAFFVDLMEGKGIYESLGRNFGEDFTAAMEDAESAAEYDRGLSEWRERSEELRQREEAMRANLEAAKTEYEQFLADNGYSDEERALLEEDMMNGSRAMGEGRYMDYVRALHRSRRYDQDVENARSEGEVRGRNARIAEERSMPTRGGDGLPSMQGMARADEGAVRKPDSRWSEDEFWNG